MQSNIAVLSELDEFMIFKSIKADVFIIKNEQEAKDKLLELAKLYKIIYINIELSEKLASIIAQFDEEPYPIISILPSSSSRTDIGFTKILNLAKETLGIDVFKE